MPHIWFFFLRLCFCKLWSAASSKLKRILILKQTCYKDVEFFLRQQRTTLSSSVSFLSIRDQTTCACWSKKKKKKKWLEDTTVFSSSPCWDHQDQQACPTYMGHWYHATPLWQYIVNLRHVAPLQENITKSLPRAASSIHFHLSVFTPGHPLTLPVFVCPPTGTDFPTCWQASLPVNIKLPMTHSCRFHLRTRPDGSAGWVMEDKSELLGD